MNSQQAYDNWWNSFQWQAFEENTVPDNALSQYGHYLTYSAGDSVFDSPMMLSVSAWERSTSWAGTVNKASEIKAAIGLGGTMIPFDGGAIWVNLGDPFSQRMGDENDTVRRVYMNIEVEFISAT